jgi:hypothetical protein
MSQAGWNKSGIRTEDWDGDDKELSYRISLKKRKNNRQDEENLQKSEWMD